MPTTDQVLIQQRANLLRELVELAARGRSPAEEGRYRAHGNRIVEEIERTEKLLGLLGTGPSDEYVQMKPAKAVVHYLMQEGEPRTRGQIIKALIAGGIRKPAGTINRVISMFQEGPPLAKDKEAARTLKEINGFVGLNSWDDSMFESSR